MPSTDPWTGLIFLTPTKAPFCGLVYMDNVVEEIFVSEARSQFFITI